MFDRQIAYWGMEKQKLLENSSILVAGIGGLGCLLSEILVRAGVGRIYLCDDGEIDESDLNRQFLYYKEDVGEKKINIAIKRLAKIHSTTEIVSVNGKIDHDFIIPEDILGVVDCLDNYESRFALWDRLESGMFLVHSGVERFFGQVLTLIKEKSPMLSDIFLNLDENTRPIPISADSAAVISSIASVEVIKNIFRNPALVNTFLIIDLSDFTFNKIQVC